MKKIISLLLCIVVLFCLVSCNKNKEKYEPKAKVNYSTEEETFFSYTNYGSYKHIEEGTCYIDKVNVNSTANNTVSIKVDVNVDIEEYESSSKFGIAIEVQLLDQNNNVVKTLYAKVPHNECGKYAHCRTSVYFFNIPDEEVTYTVLINE